jgi:hypothetical protein
VHLGPLGGDFVLFGERVVLAAVVDRRHQFLEKALEKGDRGDTDSGRHLLEHFRELALAGLGKVLVLGPDSASSHVCVGVYVRVCVEIEKYISIVCTEGGGGVSACVCGGEGGGGGGGWGVCVFVYGVYVRVCALVQVYVLKGGTPSGKWTVSKYQ